MSTICLLPLERSHIVSSPLLAQAVVAAGTWAAVDGASSVPWLQAASSSVAAASRTGHLRRLLIPRSSVSSAPAPAGRYGDAYDRMHSISCRDVGTPAPPPTSAGRRAGYWAHGPSGDAAGGADAGQAGRRAARG